MKKALFINLFLFFSFSLFSQTPAVEWQKTLGGSAVEEGKVIRQTTDGGYIIGANSWSNDGDVTENLGFQDIWIVKTDASGDIEWQRSIGGSSSETIYAIQQTTDGGYIVGGETISNDGDVSGNHGSRDYWVVKLDHEGNIEWQKCLGGSSDETAMSVKQTTDGGYIVTGYTYSNDGDVSGNYGDFDYWLVKLDPVGNMEWQKTYGGSNGDFAYSIQQTADGGYVMAGYTISEDGDVSNNHGEGDAWVVKVDSSGNMEWEKSFGGSGSEEATYIQQTADNGYILAGGTTTQNDGDVSGYHGIKDYWVVKLDETGNMEWQKCLGGSGYDSASSIQQAIDGGYIVTGTTESTDGDVSGNGQGFSIAWTVKLDASGAIAWQKCVGGGGTGANDIQQTTDGGFIFIGWQILSVFDTDVWVIKLEAEILGTTEFENQIALYPNPTTGIVNIQTKEKINSVSVYNAAGQKVEFNSLNKENTSIDISSLSGGIYFIELNLNNKTIKRYKVIRK